MATVVVFVSLTSALMLSGHGNTLAAAQSISSSTSITTPVRVVVPDLAGMLYPMQGQFQSVPFGTSASANLFTSIQDVDPEDAGFTGTSNSSTLCNATLFCVDLVFTSVFEVDPFVLTRYDAKFPVNASISDGIDVALIQPVITGGSANATNSTNRNSSDALPATWWRFSTVYSPPSPSVIDLLLRFKQQSQLRSKKDQLLLHLVVRFENEATTLHSAIEAFSLYGNEIVAHEVRRIESNRAQIAVAIERNATQRDVIVEDAYPLVPLVTPSAGEYDGKWVHQQPQCLACASELYGCSIADLRTGECDFESSRAPFVTCVRDTMGVDRSWLTTQLNQNDIGFEIPVQDFLSHCIDALLWNGTIALSCLANRQCPVGPFRSASDSSSPEKILLLTNTSTCVHTLAISDESFSGYVEIRFVSSTGVVGHTVTTETLTEASSSDDFVAAIISALGRHDELSISCQKTFSVAANAWNVVLTYKNLVFPHVVSEFKMLTSATALDESHATPSFAMLQVAATTENQLVPVNTCAACATKLDACQQNALCRETVSPCLITQLAQLTQNRSSLGVYDPQFGTMRVDFLAALHTCTDSTSMETWNPVHSAFLCLARYQCAVGATSAEEATILKIRNGTQVFAVSLEGEDVGDDEIVALTFMRSNRGSLQNFNFNAPVVNSPLFLRSFVLGNGGDVTVHSSAFDLPLRRLTLEYSSLLGDMPSIREDASFRSWIKNTSVQAYFEFASDTDDDDAGGENGLVLDSLLTLLREKALSLTPIGSPSNHSWMLAPECLQCSASLFACSPEDVANQTCSYNGMASVFGRCLRDQIPTSVFQSLLNNNASNNSLAAGISSSTPQPRSSATEIGYCSRKATMALGDPIVLAATRKMNSDLGCFSANKCPFGPLDAIASHSREVVLLDTSSYVHLLRIHSKTFQIFLEYRFGDVVIGQVAFENSISSSALISNINSALAFSGVIARVRSFENEAAGTEWTIELHYNHVIIPGFSVRIGSASVPSSKSGIEQFSMKASPRLIVAPRDQRKILRASSTNTTWNTTNTMCSACSSSKYLDACRKSRFCQRTMLPCMVDKLTKTPVASNAAAGNELDVTSLLRACASSSTVNGSTFYNWWSPLSDLFACYAKAQCPISGGSDLLSPDEAGFADTAPTFLKFTPGKEEVYIPVDEVSHNFSLSLFPGGSGTSFPRCAPFAFQGTGSDLERVLMHMTQGTGNVTVTVATFSGSDNLTRVTMSYGDQYMGLIPVLIFPVGGSSSLRREPRLLLTASTAASGSSSMPNWGRFLDILRNASTQPSSTPTCSECETQFLAMCRDTTDCGGKFLQCLADHIESDAVLLDTVDKDFMGALEFCTSSVLASAPTLVYSFLFCYEQAQCVVSDSEAADDAGGSSPTFFRLQPGVTSFSLRWSATAKFSVKIISSQDGTIWESFYGTLESLRALLETSTLSLRIRTRQLEVTPVEVLHVDIVYDGYYGTFPFVNVTPGNSIGFVTRVKPQLVLFSSDGSAVPSATRLVNTLSTYMLRSECSEVCSEPLAACTKGDSRASLECREVVLPCFTELLNASNSSVAINASVDLFSGLRACINDNVLASLELLEPFLTCYIATECPLTTQDGTSVPTYLSIQPGVENLLVTNTSVTFVIDSPSGFDPEPPTYFQHLNFWEDDDASYLQNVLQRAVLASLATVQVQANFNSEDLIHVLVTYRDYLGELPVIVGVGDNEPILLPCLVPKLTAPFADNSSQTTEVTRTSDATGVDLTDAMATCASDLLVQEWATLGIFFQCLMDAKCQVSSTTERRDHHNATYAVLPQSISIVAPTSLYDVGGSSSFSNLSHSSYTHTIELNADDEYAEFAQFLNDLFRGSGTGAEGITVTENSALDNPGMRNLTATYDSYYGPLPLITGTGITTLDTGAHDCCSSRSAEFRTGARFSCSSTLYCGCYDLRPASSTPQPGTTPAPATPAPATTPAPGSSLAPATTPAPAP
ncbi:hypothetical protein FI667_g13746, partial [Globisporangium splendens]